MNFDILKDNDKNLQVTFESLEAEIKRLKEEYKKNRDAILTVFEQQQKNIATQLAQVAGGLDQIAKMHQGPKV